MSTEFYLELKKRGKTCNNPYLHGCGLEWKDEKKKEFFFKKLKKREEAKKLTEQAMCTSCKIGFFIPPHICTHESPHECNLCILEEEIE